MNLCVNITVKIIRVQTRSIWNNSGMHASCLPFLSVLFLGAITHGESVKTPAVNDRISLIPQTLEVNVIRCPNQVTDVPAPGSHVAEVSPLMGDLFEVHFPVVLVAAIACSLALQALVALDA